MKSVDVADGIRSVLEAPSPATLTLLRADGEAITSPIWFRVHGEWLEWVSAATDAKLEHLRLDPRCSVLVFEAVRPFRGEGARTRLDIASRYLGAEDGE